MITSRDAEEFLLDRCAQAACGGGEIAQNQMEANVFRVASMIIGPQFPIASERLLESIPSLLLRSNCRS